jgi:D-alanyl-D-alanine dipeptidase
MPISALGAAPLAAPDTTAKVNDSSAAAESFAGLLAGVMKAQARPAVAAKPDGTSELDQTPSDDSADTGSAGESTESSTAAKSAKANLIATIATTAAANAAATAAATNGIVRSVATLDPQLQAKLARVAARVRDETGHTVSVAETYRTQARQNALYAQGRDTAGPVVTWTQSSKHTEGRAVDVTLDNGAAGPDAYAALQRIANEEGLRTLGARDPGHLELRGNGAKAPGDVAPTISSEPADASGTGQVSIARLAQVARVANVDKQRPIAVARVATVAQVDPRDGYAAFNSAAVSRDAASSFSTTAAPAAAGTDAAARAEKIMNALDSAPARSLSQITLSVDDTNGQTDRVQVSLRGASLTAQVDTADNRAAQLMSARSDELARALSRDGIELQELRIRTAQTGTVTSASTAQQSGAGADAQTQSRFDRGETWQQQRDQQQQQQQDRQDRQDRQRSQQDRSSGRHQQRQRRGGEQ